MDRVEGYGGYRFGMTLKEADALVSAISHTVEQVNISFDRLHPHTPGARKKVLSSNARPLIETFVD